MGGRFTYVHTWAGFVYVAFVIDAYAWDYKISPTAAVIPEGVLYIPANRAKSASALMRVSDLDVGEL